MKRFFLIGIVMCGSLLPGHAQQPVGITYNLKQCIDTGISRNLVVNQNGLQVKSSEIAKRQARLNMLPDLNGNTNLGINQGRSIDPFTNGYINEQVNYSNYSLTSGVTLFNGLAMQQANRQAAFAYEASKMDLQQAKDNLAINIILAYLTVLSNEDQLVQARLQAELTSRQAQRLDTLLKDGAIKPSDASDMKGQLASDRLAVLNRENAVQTSKLSLCQLMNIQYNRSMQLEKIDPAAYIANYAETPDEIYETALKQFARVRSEELRTKSFESAVKVARGLLFPRLSLNGSVNTNYSSAANQNTLINTTDVQTNNYVVINGNNSPVFAKQNNFRSDKISYSKQLNNNVFSSVNLNLSVPLFNNLFQRNRVKLARLDVINQTLTEQSVKTGLQQDIERAHLNMSTAFETYKTLIDQVAAYKESFRAAEIRFNEGVGNSIDYLIAKNNFDRASSNLIISRYDYVLKTKILDYYQGKATW
jgi:outer membrane protein